VQFPRYVYRVPGPIKKRGLPDYDRALCIDDAAYAKAKAAGWHDAIGDAVEVGKKPAPAKQDAPQKPAAPKPAPAAPKDDE
jgi:hypothetical protein